MSTVAAVMFAPVRGTSMSFSVAFFLALFGHLANTLRNLLAEVRRAFFHVIDHALTIVVRD